MSTRSIVGAGLTAVAVGIAINAFIVNRPSRPVEIAPPPQQRVPTVDKANTVTVAAKEIKRGDRITMNELSSLKLAQQRPDGSIARPSDLAGAVALEDIETGQILFNSSVSHDASVRPGLAALVPTGMRAMALRVNDESAVGDFLRPDDSVDIELEIPADKLAKIRGANVTTAGRPETLTLLQHVKVLSVGGTLTVAQDDRAIRMQNLTVAVTPKEALLLGLGTQIGSFYLVLRHPSDTAESSDLSANVDDILHRDGESSGRARTKAALGGRRTHQITIIEGTREVHYDVP